MDSKDIIIIILSVLLVFNGLWILYSKYNTLIKENQRTYEISKIVRKLRSLRLNLQAHPENEPNSEFEDRIDDLTEIIETLEK